MTDYRYDFDGLSREKMREKMPKGWKNPETICGRGSQIKNTVAIRDWLPKAVHYYDIHSLNDAGAGDLNWIQKVEWYEPIEYRAFDLVRRRPEVTPCDITSEVLPYADAILCRHVLNHLSPALSIDAVDNFVKSGAVYLFVTNTDKQIEYWGEHGLRLKEPENKWKDATHWWVELHKLQEGIWDEKPNRR